MILLVLIIIIIMVKLKLKLIILFIHIKVLNALNYFRIKTILTLILVLTISNTRKSI